MRLTIIRDMGQVQVNGRGHDEVDMSTVPVNINAVQWYGEHGEIEYTDPDLVNDFITSLPSWAEDLAIERKAVIDAEIAEEEEYAEYLKTPEGLAETARNERDFLLERCDWAAGTDVVMSEEMAAYRQALRDITDQAGFPENIDWPIKP